MTPRLDRLSGMEGQGTAKAKGTQASSVPCGPMAPPEWWAKIRHRFSRLPGPRWLWGTVLVGVVIFWGVADIRLRGLPWPDRPLEHKTDFTVYTTAGRAFFTGENPYEVPNPRGWKYLYPPLFALLVAPLSLLPMAEQCLVWYFISVMFCWGCYREVSRILNGFQLQIDRWRHAISPQWWSFLGTFAFLAALFPTLNCLQRGQVGVLKLYLLLLGVRLVWQSASWVGQSLGGLALAGAIVLKLTPALAVGMVLWAQLAAVWGAWHGRRKALADRKEPAQSMRPIIQAPHFVYIRTQTGASGQPKPSGTLDESSCSALDSRGGAISPSERAVGLFARTGLGVAAGLILLFVLLPAGIIGWQKNLEHLSYWASRVLPSAGEGFPKEEWLPGSSRQTGEVESPPANDRTVRNQSLANAMFRLAAFIDSVGFGGPDDRLFDYVATAPHRINTAWYQAIQKAVRGFLLGCLLLAGWMLGVSGSRIGQAAAFGLGCVGILVISPIAWGHYFMLLAPGVLFVPLWLLEHGRPKSAIWFAAAPAALSMLHYALLDKAGRIGLLGLGTAGWLLTACIFIVVISLRSAGRQEGDRCSNVQSAPSENKATFPIAYVARDA